MKHSFNEENIPLAALLVVISLALRLFYMGYVCLLPEEAYYWQYAQHPALGYLDHPPMVALTIRAFSSLFGVNEFAVRIGAVFWWSLAAVGVFRLTNEIYDRKAAAAAVALFALLPYFIGSGLLMTPDAPLLAFWAFALYFLFRALVEGDSMSWWGVGLCLGLGMLSKYSIALLGLSTLVYMLWHKPARGEFFSFRPYLAAVTAALLFSPVLIWNYEHGWASFAFQSADRLRKAFEFSLHALLGHLLLVLTPVGAYVLAAVIAPGRRQALSLRELAALVLPTDAGASRFLMLFTFVPLSVFVFFSLSHEVKINWTGPVFLAFLPVLGRSAALPPEIKAGTRLSRAWLWTGGILIVLYALLLQYMSFGIPGVPHLKAYKVMTGSDVARQIMKIETEVLTTTGQKPVVVGMDKHYLASQLGFYRKKEGGDNLEETAGRNLFGLESLMYRFWTEPSRYAGRTMILVSKTPSDLDDTVVRPYFDSAGPPAEIVNKKDGQAVGRFYYRVGTGYKVMQPS